MEKKMIEKKHDEFSNKLFVQTMRLEMSEVLGNTFNNIDIMVFCAIACLESDYGHSRIALEQRNFFGMKSPKHRPTTNLNPSSKFAVYGSLRACVIDFVCWLAMQPLMFRHEWQNSRELIDYIVDTCGYCPDQGYKDKLIAVYEIIKNW